MQEFLEDRTYPVDINAQQKHVNIQIGALGHKIWLCVPGQSIVRIANAKTVSIDDTRVSKDIVTLDLTECPHMRILQHWASVSRSLKLAVKVIDDLLSFGEITDDQQAALEDLEVLEPALNWLHQAVRNKLQEQEDDVA